jgi:hypothetical protein
VKARPRAPISAATRRRQSSDQLASRPNFSRSLR